MALIRRKKYFVDRGLQLRFARFVLLYMLACCALTSVIVFYSCFSVLSEKLAGIVPQHRLPEIFHRAYLSLFLGMGVILPALFYGALKFSHRIAGPLPKIYDTLAAIGQGNFSTKLTLRKNDELKELADHINRMADSLRERESKK